MSSIAYEYVQRENFLTLVREELESDAECTPKVAGGFRLLPQVQKPDEREYSLIIQEPGENYPLWQEEIDNYGAA